MNKFFIVLVALILAGLLPVGNGPLCANNFFLLDDMQVHGDKIDLHVTGSVKYNVFKISNPARLVIELFNVEQNLKQKEINVRGSVIKRVRAAQFQNDPVKIARVVVELVKQAEYSASMHGGTISVSFAQAGIEKPAPAASATPVSTKTVPKLKPSVSTQTTIFTKTESVVSKPKPVPKKAVAPSTPVKIQVSTAVTSPVKPVVKKAVPKKSLSTKTTAVSLKTQVSTAATHSEPKELSASSITIVAAQPKETAPIVQKPAHVAVKIKPVVAETIKTAAPKTAVRRPASPKQLADKKSEIRIIGNITLPKTPVTMDYQDAEIQDVLQVLSLRSGINIIAGADVGGTISISLKDVPFDQAFNTILTIKGYTSIAVGDNILQVITPSVLSSQRQQEIVFTRIYPLNYAEAPIISGQIKSIFSSEGLKGDVNTDARTNSILVSASLEGHASVARMLKELDIRPQQVMIESRVVDVNLSNTNELGVNWSMDNIAVSGSGSGITSAGRSQSFQPDGGPAVSVSQGGKTGDKITVTGGQVAMPIPAAGGLTFNFGYISGSDILNTRIGILASEGRVKLLSNPKVTTVNNKEAKIMVGEKIPYKTTTIGQSGVSQENYTYLDAGIQLTVTPTISPDKWITLKVRPIVSVPLAAAAGAAPTVKTRETDVTVMVKDGDTIVIGGLISDSEIESMEKIPVLGDIPLFGYLFKHRLQQKIRSELLIFITPKILEG